MPIESLFLLAKRLDGDVTHILSRVDLDDVAAAVRERIRVLKRELTELRGDVHEYELAETRTEQRQLGVAAHRRLGDAEEHILHLSQYNMFSPVEVAELSAHIDKLRQALA